MSLNETTLSPVLEKEADKKTSLLENLNKITEFCHNNKISSEKVEYIKDKINNNNFVVTVLGEFNRGKSTFINSLLGASILPMGITPTTATVNIVSYSETAYADVEYNDGKTEHFSELNTDTFKNLNPDNIKEVRIGYPSELLKGLSIVDTPGVNDINEQRLDVTYGFIPKSDAVIFVLDSEQLLSKSEANFLDRRILSKDINKLIFVANKAENLEKEEINLVIEYAYSKLKNFIPEPVVIPYSAKLALQSKTENNPEKLEKSYFNQLIGSLNTNFIEKQQDILIENSRKNAFNIVLTMINNLEMDKQFQQKSLEELNENITLISKNEEELNKKLDDVVSIANLKVMDLKKEQITALKEFSLHFTQVINTEIDDISYEDLKKYFPHFVQDKYKEWLELHEAEINVEMLQIFEESIKGIEDIFSKLKNDLSINLEFSNVKFKVPGKTYGIDIGTSALMSAGLFVITVFGGMASLIAGGLLLVGGGYLALSLKGNREKAYVEDFKELARNCVLKTSDKIIPKLEEMINNIALKLEEQVREMFSKELNTIKDSLAKAHEMYTLKNEDYNAVNDNIDKNINYLNDLLESLK